MAGPEFRRNFRSSANITCGRVGNTENWVNNRSLFCINVLFPQARLRTNASSRGIRRVLTSRALHGDSVRRSGFAGADPFPALPWQGLQRWTAQAMRSPNNSNEIKDFSGFSWQSRAVLRLDLGGNHGVVTQPLLPTTAPVAAEKAVLLYGEPLHWVMLGEYEPTG